LTPEANKSTRRRRPEREGKLKGVKKKKQTKKHTFYPKRPPRTKKKYQDREVLSEVKEWQVPSRGGRITKGWPETTLKETTLHVEIWEIKNENRQVIKNCVTHPWEKEEPNTKPETEGLKRDPTFKEKKKYRKKMGCKSRRLQKHGRKRGLNEKGVSRGKKSSKKKWKKGKGPKNPGIDGRVGKDQKTRTKRERL